MSLDKLNNYANNFKYGGDRV